ncbi:MAG: gamma-glutamyltransferase [Vicinamibacteria bacterium]|nr:gamma-glutamyltransferase [Vicinamibacteria bacterium]
MRLRVPAVFATLSLLAVPSPALAGAHPLRAKNGMVVSQHFAASQVGIEVLWEGGTAVDAAVATAFALAVVHPTAGNIGGGGFLLLRPAKGEPIAYDFRETAPAAAAPTMFLNEGRYDAAKHHDSHLAVGVPGTVAGLHLAWKQHGKLPWQRLLEPAIQMAEQGFLVTEELSRSLAGVLPQLAKYPASKAAYSRDGKPYEAGDLLVQKDLARTLRRIAERGPAGFYQGETARLIAKEMAARGGLITEKDLAAYSPQVRVPVRGQYRGHDVISMPPPSSGGVALIQVLNILEGDDLEAMGFRSAASVHLITEALRRAFADRAQHLGDPDHNPEMPLARLLSKDYARLLRQTIRADRAAVSSPETFEWPVESDETTHFSVVDAERNAVALTYTLEAGYGSKIVVPGAGFLLNNEMGDFNAGPGLTDDTGLIGTAPNLAAPGKRMLSSMAPTILAKDGALRMVTGSLGGRTIISTVLHTILNVVDYGMNVQEAVDAARFHHQWLPDVIRYERHGLSPDTLALLADRGHRLEPLGLLGVAAAITYDKEKDRLEGAADRRSPDSAAVGR